MSNIPKTSVRSAVRRLLYSTLGIQMLALPAAYAQTATNQGPVKLEKTVVTGSLIPTAETVGPAPVEAISAAQIEKVGATDVLDLVKRLSPSFSGNANIGQTVNNG